MRERSLGKPMVCSSSVWYAIQYLRHCPPFFRAKILGCIFLCHHHFWKKHFSFSFSEESGSFWEGGHRVYSRNIMTYFWNSVNKEMKKICSQKRKMKLLVLCYIKEIILKQNYYHILLRTVSGFLELLQ